MKTIVLHSKRHGVKTVFVDDKDLEVVSPYRWCVKPSRGSFCASTNITINGRRTTLSMHRLIMQPPPEKHIDHKDLNALNNQRSNLRECNRSQNGMNRRAQKNNVSSFKGVSCREYNRFYARITVNGETKQIGAFGTAEEAALAYDECAKQLHGEFARINF